MPCLAGSGLTGVEPPTAKSQILFYWRRTAKRLMEYPSAPPMKTSDRKWADKDSLENPTTAAMP